MKLSRNDKTVLVAGLVIIVLFSGLFYYDLTRRRGAGSEEVVGTITFKRQQAQRKYASQVVWEDVAEAVPVHNHDSIRTAELSEAVIKLKDGTEIALNENSMILISFSKNEVDIEFAQGSINAKRGDADPKQKMNIKSKDTVVSIDKSDVSLTRMGGTDLNLTVNRGTAKINRGETEKLIRQDEKAVLSKDALTIYRLNLKLLSPTPNEHITTTAARHRVQFSWEAVRDAADIHHEVAQSPSFGDIVSIRRIAGEGRTLELPSGIYYWRLRAMNRKTRKIEYSEVRRLSITRDAPLSLISPHDGATYSYNAKKPLVSFKWSGSELSSSYTLTVASDSSMSRVVQRIDTSATGAALDTLGSGTYYCMVRRSGAGQSVSSPVHRFTITQTASLDPPELVFPPDARQFNKISLKNGTITFTWRTVPEIGSSRIDIARDRGFTNIIHTGTSATNFAKLTGALDTGPYFWRVTGMIRGGSESVTSSARQFRIIESDVIAIIAPRDNATIAPDGEDTAAAVAFSWKRTEMPGQFHLVVSRDSGLSSAVRDARTDGHHQTVKGLEPGRYFWQVRQLDKSGAAIMKGPVVSFTVAERMGTPVVIAPAIREVVDMDASDALHFKWNRLRGANHYRIELFQQDGDVLKPIVRHTTRDGEWKMTELEKLDVGNFCWTLQAFDRAPGATAVRKSPLVKTCFEITLGKSLRKTKLKSPRVIYVK